MKYSQPLLSVVLCLMLLGLVSCSDDDGDSITLSTPINAAGVWDFAGQLTKNTCELDVTSPISGGITFNQNGSIVNTSTIYLSLTRDDTTWNFRYAGTVTGKSLSMAATDPYVLQQSGAVIHFGSGIDIQNINNNAGTGSLHLTGQCIQGCTGSCQTIWTGTCTKR